MAKGLKTKTRNAVIFVCLAAAWLAFDAVTKAFFEAEAIAASSGVSGVFHFRLVHNTGGAWGIFGDSTFILGIIALLVCIVLALYVFVFAKQVNLLQVVGLALVFAGGLGNAISRFTLGYVVDFIELGFIDFPVFNIADIGVTCGVVMFLLGLLLAWRHEGKHAAQDAGRIEDATGFVRADKEEPTEEFLESDDGGRR